MSKTRDRSGTSTHSVIGTTGDAISRISSLLISTHLVTPRSKRVTAVFPGQNRLITPNAPVVGLIIVSSVRIMLGMERSLVPSFHVKNAFVKSIPTLTRGKVKFGVCCVDPLNDFTA